MLEITGAALATRAALPPVDLLGSLVLIVCAVSMWWTVSLTAWLAVSGLVASVFMDGGPLGLWFLVILSAGLLAATAKRRHRHVFFTVAAIVGVVFTHADYTLLGHAIVYLGLFFIPLIGSYLGGRAYRRWWLRHQEARQDVEGAARAKSEALHDQRRRIARDLHDIVAHDLTVISMHAQAVDDEVTDPVVRATLETIQGASAHALQDLRRMLDILRNEGLVSGSPSEISAARLDDEIARCASILRDLGFTVELDVPVGLADLPMSLQSTLRWVLQECTTNVAKHGDAGGSVDAPDCRISVEQEPSCVSLRVANTASSRSGASGRILGVGLDSMRHRVEHHGGRFGAGYLSAETWEVRAEGLRKFAYEVS